MERRSEVLRDSLDDHEYQITKVQESITKVLAYPEYSWHRIHVLYEFI